MNPIERLNAEYLAKAPTLKVKKLHPNAVIPAKQTPGSAGMDLTAVSVAVEHFSPYPLRHQCKYIYGTGLAFEIPVGHVGLVFPRSSIHKTCMDLTNCVAVLDEDFRGEIKLVFRARDAQAYEDVYEVGERIGQLVIVKLPSFNVEVVDQLSDTQRGTGGFGSTGR